MKLVMLLPAIIFSFITCSQTITNNTYNNVGGPCEGCEAIYESPIPFEKLSHEVWLPDWKMTGRKLAINGIVYKADGTPAAGVILYIYHTDQTGEYPTTGNENGWAIRHGNLRGWMKTNEKGEYKFFTLIPKSYPNSKSPAHIHVTIKEPDKNEYYIDEYVFDDDPLLTSQERANCKNRGGSGIVTLKEAENIWKAERHIYLGKNIPNYPKQ